MKAALDFIATSTPLHLAFAFLAMGGWGFWVNTSHPLPQALAAGALQGVMSTALTLFLKKSVDVLRGAFGGHLRYWAPPLLASLGTASLLVFGHWVAATPEILATVALPLSVSVSYVLAYNILRAHKGARID